MNLEAITKGWAALSRQEPVMSWTRIVAVQMERSGSQWLEAEVAGLCERLHTGAEGVGMSPRVLGGARSVMACVYAQSTLSETLLGSSWVAVCCTVWVSGFSQLQLGLEVGLSPKSVSHSKSVSWPWTYEVICHPKLPKQEGWAKSKFFLEFEVSSKDTYVDWQQL